MRKSKAVEVFETTFGLFSKALKGCGSVIYVYPKKKEKATFFGFMLVDGSVYMTGCSSAGYSLGKCAIRLGMLNPGAKDAFESSVRGVAFALANKRFPKGACAFTIDEDGALLCGFGVRIPVTTSDYGSSYRPLDDLGTVSYMGAAALFKFSAGDGYGTSIHAENGNSAIISTINEYSFILSRTDAAVLRACGACLGNDVVKKASLLANDGLVELCKGNENDVAVFALRSQSGMVEFTADTETKVITYGVAQALIAKASVLFATVDAKELTDAVKKLRPFMTEPEGRYTSDTFALAVTERACSKKLAVYRFEPKGGRMTRACAVCTIDADDLCEVPKGFAIYIKASDIAPLKSADGKVNIKMDPVDQDDSTTTAISLTFGENVLYILTFTAAEWPNSDEI